MLARTSTALLLAILVLATLTARPAAAQTPTPTPTPEGRFISGAIPPDGGFGLVVFSGGSYDQLVTASGCPAARIAFWVTQGGAFLVYVPTTTVGAVNAPFEAAFPARTIPPMTPFIGRCAPAGASGIQGLVTLGPVCAVESTLLPCPDRPYAGATVVVTNALALCPAIGCAEVARTTSGSDGRYRIALPPGTYTVTAQAPGTRFPTPPPPVTTTVPSGVFVTVDLPYDSGIRSLQ